ncbi:MAG TPA: hypothetical protein VJZ26_18760, partial [Blastocatellia bacterium]|nr:hypothetical protein [Blastocatellia bacterium]
MKDDYLWDKTGDPDPDVQRLEQTLSRFRYQPRPLEAVFDKQLSARRTDWRPMLAAAAAIILVALAGLWAVRNQHRSDAGQPVAATPDAVEQVAKEQVAREQAAPPPAQKEIPAQAKQSADDVSGRLAVGRKPARKVAPSAPKEVRPEQVEPERFDSAPGSAEVAVVQPIVVPFVDVETSKHIERAQVLLRSFRNMGDAGGDRDGDIAYEKRQSRELLYQNIVLRRDAEAKGNMPVEDLLGSLEPFLIDIANLPEKPSRD